MGVGNHMEDCRFLTERFVDYTVGSKSNGGE